MAGLFGNANMGAILNSGGALPGLMYLSYEPMLSIYWYYCDEQPYVVAFLHNHPEYPHDWGLDE